MVPVIRIGIILLCIGLATLLSIKLGPAVVRHYHGDAQSAAKTLTINDSCTEGGACPISERLDKICTAYKTSQFHVDLADFHDYY